MVYYLLVQTHNPSLLSTFWQDLSGLITFRVTCFSSQTYKETLHDNTDLAAVLAISSKATDERIKVTSP